MIWIIIYGQISITIQTHAVIHTFVISNECAEKLQQLCICIAQSLQ